MATTPADRIVTLDIVRGVAVMGILAMNIVSFAQPPAAYMNPLAYGAERAVDMASYAFSFIFVDGKMRGLFSFLFGASMLLVIQRAEASGASAGAIHYRRMAVLLLIGLIHFYFIWYGDILVHYALIGMVAFAFRYSSARTLIGWSVALLTVQLLLFAGFAFSAHALSPIVAGHNPPSAALESWRSLSANLNVPTPAELRKEFDFFLGPWWEIAHKRLTDELFMPLFFTVIFGCETLAYMLLGMAALNSGLLAGAWENSAYRRLAIACLAIAVPAYAIILWLLFRDGFTVPGLHAYSFTATVPFRPLMILAYVAIVILATRRGGALVDRIAATGRAAFTNYLGTSILMTFLFYGWGLGLFGQLSRAELWLPVVLAWVVMLAWSKPWLGRFRYGPLEWLWRSLARGKLQPIRRQAAATALPR